MCFIAATVVRCWIERDAETMIHMLGEMAPCVIDQQHSRLQLGGFLGALVVKNLPTNAGGAEDVGSIPG